MVETVRDLRGDWERLEGRLVETSRDWRGD